VHRDGTAEQVRMNFTRHVYPRLGHRPLAPVRPSEVQALVKSLTATLSPATVGVIHSWVSSVFKAAIADRLVAASPRAGTKLPPIERSKVVPLEVETVLALAERIEARYRARGGQRHAHLRSARADRRQSRLLAPASHD
jgi:hypothetical protein